MHGAFGLMATSRHGAGTLTGDSLAELPVAAWRNGESIRRSGRAFAAIPPIPPMVS